MKKFTMLAMLVLFVSFASAKHLKENEVPSAVKSTFQKQFPEAKKLEWEKEDGNFEAEFEINKVEMTATIDKDGKLLETETEIAISELPKEVIAYTKEHCKAKKIKEASKIVDSKGVTTYEAEVKGKKMTFDNNGKFINSKKD